MRTPTVHRNGSSRDTLREGYREAADALLAASKALRATYPNGRDYYPQGDFAIREAMAEHAARCSRVESVLEEVRELQEAVEAGA